MSGSQLIRLSRSCTIAEVPDQRAALLDAISTGQGPIEIDVSAVADADITLVQMLVATRLSAARQGRAIQVSAWSSAASSVLAKAGFSVETFAPAATQKE